MAAISITAQQDWHSVDDFIKPSVQDKLFTRILAVLFVVYLLLAVIVPSLEQVKIAREIKERPPAHLAKILLKEKQLPPPKKPKIEPKKEPLKKVKKQPVKSKKKAIKQTVQQIKEQAKTTANNTGLATMKDELFAMREAFDIAPTTAVKLKKSSNEATKIKRKLLAAETTKQSEKLAQSSLRTTVASDKLSTKSTEHVRLGEKEILANNQLEQEESLTPTLGQRSEMAIRRTLEAHKARLYSLYNRALRKDPLLQGKVLFEIEIQPSGKISHVSIKSSALNNAKLERQLTLILGRIKFPHEDVAAMMTIWAIEFLPS